MFLVFGPPYLRLSLVWSMVSGRRGCLAHSSWLACPVSPQKAPTHLHLPPPCAGCMCVHVRAGAPCVCVFATHSLSPQWLLCLLLPCLSTIRPPCPVVLIQPCPHLSPASIGTRFPFPYLALPFRLASHCLSLPHWFLIAPSIPTCRMEHVCTCRRAWTR
ncbi:hypothetical protein V8C44DRAFT_82734 [Trichoderma aethiopicum]